MINDNHVLVTEPDRVYDNSIKIFLIDFSFDYLESIFPSFTNCPAPLSFHVFNSDSINYQWAIDVANQANVIIINLNDDTKIDLLKGYVIAKNKVFLVGTKLNIPNLRYTSSVVDTILKTIATNKTEE